MSDREPIPNEDQILTYNNGVDECKLLKTEGQEIIRVYSYEEVANLSWEARSELNPFEFAQIAGQNGFPVNGETRVVTAIGKHVDHPLILTVAELEDAAWWLDEVSLVSIMMDGSFQLTWRKTEEESAAVELGIFGIPRGEHAPQYALALLEATGSDALRDHPALKGLITSELTVS